MTTLSIPCTSNEQALAVIQHGWAVVDGDEQWVPDKASDSSCTLRISPPAEWLKALTCETCHGFRAIQGLVEGTSMSLQCPDCLGAGKPRIEVTAPCPKCEATGCDIDYCMDCGHEYTDPCPRHEHGELSDCVECCPDCTDGWLHVGWVTVTEVLPVVADTGYPPQTIPCIVDIGDGVIVHVTEDQFDIIVTDITADVAHLGNPGDLVGRWLLKVEVVA